MEPPEPTPAKFKLWRWLLLLSVITVALSGFVWWTLRSERLRFVEVIWSDSLARHENGAATTSQRQKVGEIWSLTCISGVRLFGRGLSRTFEGQFPVFPANNAFHQSVSDQLLAERRRIANIDRGVTWLQWWEGFKAPRLNTVFNFSCEVIFVGPQTVSICQETSEYGAGFRHLTSVHGRSFVKQDGELHQVKLDELFHGPDGLTAVSDFCLLDLRRQGATWAQPSATGHLRMNEFNGEIASSFALLSEGLRIYFSPNVAGPFSDGTFEVLIPFEKLAEHLRSDGLHRLFQTQVSE